MTSVSNGVMLFLAMTVLLALSADAFSLNDASGGSPSSPSMNTLNDPPPAILAQALEERGFESLWYGEHSHIPCSRMTPYPPGGELPAPYSHMMDPYLSLMAAAAATTTLRLGTGIALLMERELFSQAKTIATLDRLSGGRVIIGTGVGWNRDEMENHGTNFKTRLSLTKERIEAMKAIWGQTKAEYHGKYVDFAPMMTWPKTV